MGGFASGFRAGYGLVNDTYEGIRREQQDAAQAQFNQEKLAAEQARLRQDSRYNSERLRLQGDGNRQQADYNRDRLAELRKQTQIAENQFQVTSALKGAELASTLAQNETENVRDRSAAGLDDQQAALVAQEVKAAELKNLLADQRILTKSALDEFRSTGGLSFETLVQMQGLGINPARVLDPRAEKPLRDAWQYSLGQRTDYDHPDFIGAINFLFEPDTRVMIGQTPAGRAAPIAGQKIVDLKAVEGKEGVFHFVVENTLENGDVYQSYMTKGRGAGEAPAEISVDVLAQQIEGNTAAMEAYRQPAVFKNLVDTYAAGDSRVVELAQKLRDNDLVYNQPVQGGDHYRAQAIGLLYGSTALPGADIDPNSKPKESSQPTKPGSPSLFEILSAGGSIQRGNPGASPAPNNTAQPPSFFEILSAGGRIQPPEPAQDQGTAAVNSVLGSSTPAPQPTQPPSIGEIRRAIMMQFRGSDQFVNELTDQEVLEYYRSGQVTL